MPKVAAKSLMRDWEVQCYGTAPWPRRSEASGLRDPNLPESSFGSGSFLGVGALLFWF